jgi:hypothetical protein
VAKQRFVTLTTTMTKTMDCFLASFYLFDKSPPNFKKIITADGPATVVRASDFPKEAKT